MSKLQTILLTLAVSLTVFAIILVSRPQAVPFSGVGSNRDNYATTTKTLAGTSNFTYKVLQACPTALARVTITGANTGIMRFYDATTTGAHSDHATTTIAEIPASTVAGDYTFQSHVVRGLVYELVSGLAPTSTIAYEANCEIQ